MANTINFGIDLGTTNSLIAKFTKGSVEVFRNPNGFKETLPSIVGFRKDRILVGEQAKNYADKDPNNVVRRFKRKMGTTESYKIESLNQSKTPIELSAFVLKELKTFIHTGETPESVVITVPASFDMLQSNATKEAGHQAGFKHVVLLQEPIAASLAYANKEKNIDLKNSQWIVYDLGGGTFDVALVRIVEGELKVVDHEGNNYLGGCDFDELIVEKVIVPKIEKEGKFTDLFSQMKSATGKYNRLWNILLHKAEEAKIELSAKTSSEIDFDVKDESGNESNVLLTITRSEYESLIKELVDTTAEMLKKILTRNSLQPGDLKFVLMVGGATYTPYIRKRIEETLGIPANTNIDPTNAIAIGAAYYAASKEIASTAEPAKEAGSPLLKIKTSYYKVSQEKEELFSAKIEGQIDGLNYRITREDGGFDSGLKKLSTLITEDLPLQMDAYNFFTMTIYDAKNNPISAGLQTIQITQGKYSVAGQMLPDDLCLVKDDPNSGDTKLELIFGRNSIIPAKKTMTAEVSKTIVQNSDDEIRILVTEGSLDHHFLTNKQVGALVIEGKGLKKDILRGTEIDLTFEMSESRDLTVTAYINPSGPDFKGIFTPSLRNVPIRTLAESIALLGKRVEEEKAEAVANQNEDVAERLEKLKSPIKDLECEVLLLSIDDATDNRYKFQDLQRNIAQELYQLTAGKHLERLKAEYHEVKEDTKLVVSGGGNDMERRQLNEVLAHEHIVLVSSNPRKIAEATQKLKIIKFQILRRTPEFLLEWFKYLVGKREVFNDQSQARTLIESGKQHVAAEDYERLAEVNMRLRNLLPQDEQESKEMKFFTGIK